VQIFLPPIFNQLYFMNRFIGKPTIAFVFLFSLVIASCRKDSSENGHDRIAKLVQKMSENSDPSADAAIAKEYFNLSADEYKVFDSLKRQNEVQQLMDSAGYAKEDAIYELKFAWDLRKVLEDEGMKKYNTPVNQLSVEQLRSLEATVTAIMVENTPELKAKQNNRALAIKCKYFHITGYSSLRSNIYYRSRSAWGYADDNVWAPICDSEHWYPGNNPYGVNASNYNSRQAILWYNSLARWWTGTNTGILIGYLPVRIYVGHPANLRMTAF